MTIDPDRKTYWDLMETMCWICTRDEQRVAALRDLKDQDKMALTLILGMRVPRVIHSPPGLSGTSRGADLEPFSPLGDKGAPHPLDDVRAKVQSGRVGMTAIRNDGGTYKQIPVPLAELNDLEFMLFDPSVAPMGLWLRSSWTLVWSSPQFLRADAVRAWPARKTQTVAVRAAILRHLREIMNAEAPLTRLEAQRRCMAEVPNFYPEAFRKAWAKLDAPYKRRRGEHGPRVH